jgi:predicted small integral membrane protein
MFAWMLWTVPSAIAFGLIVALIIVVNIVDVFAPGYSRKGFLPIATTRGDRLYISLVSAVLAFLLWMKFVPANGLIYSLAVVLPLFLVLMIWG